MAQFPGKRIVLTSDTTMMSSYHGGVMLGFAAIMPRATLPDWIFQNFFCPPCRRWRTDRRQLPPAA